MALGHEERPVLPGDARVDGLGADEHSVQVDPALRLRKDPEDVEGLRQDVEGVAIHVHPSAVVRLEDEVAIVLDDHEDVHCVVGVAEVDDAGVVWRAHGDVKTEAHCAASERGGAKKAEVLKVGGHSREACPACPGASGLQCLGRQGCKESLANKDQNMN